MQVTERLSGDVETLRELVRWERDARRRDRLRAVLLAIEGHSAVAIAELLGWSRRSVQDWVYAYRDGGIERTHPPPRPGRVPTLPPHREAEFKARFPAGPTPEDGVCTLRGQDAVRILRDEFGVHYSLDGAHDLLAHLGFSCLRPRPRHEKQDLGKQAEFRERAPSLSAPSKRR